MADRILAEITTFNPEIDRLRSNLDAIAHQVNQVIIVDNGSKNIDDILSLAVNYGNALVENLNQNNGIAFALDWAMQYALENKYDWVLSLDQDSVCKQDLIEVYQNYTHLENVGIISCNIIDRNYMDVHATDYGGSDWVEVKNCITSAMLMKTTCYFNTEGYDIPMFIDCVDVDICYNFRAHQYKVIKINYPGILHEVGNGKNVRLFGKKEVAFCHSPLRNFYQARNAICIGRKYPDEEAMYRVILREIKRELIILLYEPQKWKKLCARWKGLRESGKLWRNNLHH